MRLKPRDPALTSFLKAAPVAVVLAASASVAEAKRLALVVGNSEYDAVYSLKNAAKDARDVAAKLKSLGFEVTLLTDTGDAAFREELDAFATRAEAEDVESTLFYFSGHAFQLDGVNYLVPKDAVLNSAEAIKTATWRLDEIVKRLEDRDRSTLIFLDACRNNPLPESARGNSSSGLAKLETGSGTFVAFATQPNNVTADGAGDNSPFTLAMLDHIGTEGISISDMMIRVRNAVEDKTLGRQTPWDQSSLRAQFYFKPKNESAALSQADYEMLAALDPETRQRLLSLMGAENIKFDEDKVDDMEVAIQVASLTDEVPTAQPQSDDAAIIFTPIAEDDGISDEALEALVKEQVNSEEDTPFVFASIPEVEPEPSEPTTVATVETTGTVAVGGGSTGIVQGSTGGDTVVTIGSATGVAVPVSTGSFGTVVRRGGADAAAVDVQTGTVTAAATMEITGVEVASGADAAAQVEQSTQASDLPVITAGLLPEAPASISVFRAIPEFRSAASNSAPFAASQSPSMLLTAQEPSAEDLEVAGYTEAEVPALEGRALARAVQTELSRLGCYRMKVDGAFGRGSKLSLVRYYGNKGVAAQSLEPTNSLLQVLRAEPQVVCENTTEIDNRRVAAISTRVSQARERVAPAQKAVEVRKQRLSTGTTRTTSSGETVNTTRIRPGGFR